MANKHGQTLNIVLDDVGSTVGIRVAEPTGVASDNLLLSTWGASFILANQLHKIDVSAALFSGPPQEREREHVHKNVPRPKVLELGAGTGLVGMTAAILWRTNAILTDLPGIIPGIRANIVANTSNLSKASASIQAGTLDWLNPTCLALTNINSSTISPTEDNKFPVVLAADVVYDEDHPSLLLNTVRVWLAPGPNSRFILCYPSRMAYLDIIRDLWQKFEDAGLQCVEEGQQTGDASWDEEAPYEWSAWRWKGRGW